jgi:hypothetical protein
MTHQRRGSTRPSEGDERSPGIESTFLTASRSIGAERSIPVTRQSRGYSGAVSAVQYRFPECLVPARSAGRASLHVDPPEVLAYRAGRRTRRIARRSFGGARIEVRDRQSAATAPELSRTSTNKCRRGADSSSSSLGRIHSASAADTPTNGAAQRRRAREALALSRVCRGPRAR